MDNKSSPELPNTKATGNGIWALLANMINVIFKELQNHDACNSSMEENIRGLAESLLRRSENLSDILVPPLNETVESGSNDLQKQYFAFTTWLFQSMFFFTNIQLKLDILKSCIEVQLCMVRILSELNYDLHTKITTEYLSILEESIQFINYSKETDEVILKKFQIENCIDYLELGSFSIKMNHENVSIVQISILKIILESGVSIWPKDMLISQIFDTLIYSDHTVKVLALELCADLLKYGLFEHEQLYFALNYTVEILKTLPVWINKDGSSDGSPEQYAKILLRFIDSLQYYEYLTLHYEIIAALANGVIESSELEIRTCQKLHVYLKEHPKTYNTHDLEKFLFFYEKCQHFLKVLICFVYSEIQSKITEGPTDVSEICQLWKKLKITLFADLNSQKFERTLNFLKMTSLLETWFSEKSTINTFNDEDFEKIQDHLLQNLSINDYDSNKLIFENFISLISFKRIKKENIQEILSLPWSEATQQSPYSTKINIGSAKSLSSTIKKKCLKVLAMYGQGRQHLNIFNMCINSGVAELATASIRYSPLLLNNKDIRFEDILESILRPAFNPSKFFFCEAFANVLGYLICILSSDAYIHRDSTESHKWLVKCKFCDDNSYSDVAKPSILSSKLENCFQKFFNVISSQYNEVRLVISKNLLRFSNHLETFNNNETTYKWIMYVNDSEEEIRKNFANVISHMINNRLRISFKDVNFQDDIPDSLQEYFNIIMDKLVGVLSEALADSNHDLHRTLILTTKNVACVQTHLTERRALDIFILTILDTNSPSLAIALATEAFKEVAEYHNVSPKSMYIRYKRSFLKMIMEVAVHNWIHHNYNMATTIHRVAKCMGFQGSRQILRKDSHHALCFLLPLILKYPQAEILLSDIAELLSIEHICCFLILFESQDTMVEGFSLVSKITRTQIPDLLAKSYSLIITELMLHFHAQKESILEYLCFLSQYDDSQKISESQQDTIQILNSLLHGVLVTFDSNLGSNSEEIMQEFALLSLTEIIRYLGKDHITQYKYKILATLRTAIGFTRPGFRKLTCNAWNAFLQNTKTRELGPLLATICISLKSLHKTYPKEVDEMLEYLLVQNGHVIKEHFDDLFFISDLNISSLVSSEVLNHIKQTRPRNIQENLKLWINRINHELDEVRLKALQYLQEFLARNRGKINDMILADVNVHPIVVELLDTLLIRCQDKDELICIASSDCVGELGAIEPSLLPRRIISRVDSPFIESMNEKFAFELFQYFIPDYHAPKSTQSMDCFSLAIQEILKSFEISPRGVNSPLWNQIPSKIQHMVYPLLKSHYTRTSTNDDIDFPHPIYGSESGSTFEMWIYNWTINMLKNMKQSTIRSVLNACLPAFKRNTKILVICIPHIVAHVVCHGTPGQSKNLNSEMLAVFKVEENASVSYELSRHRPLREKHDTTPNSARVSDEARRVRCLQVIFLILDYLQRWLREKRTCQDETFNRIKAFCDTFPKLLIAEGCYQCFEYHRALLYLEQHMGSGKKSLSQEREKSLLAKIYTQLDEPDGITGILRLQGQDPSLHQLVLAHSVTGQLQDAATCYEKLVQDSVPPPKYLQGIIQCYLDLDQPFTASNMIKGVLEDRPELETLICDTEPFWRLAHFGRIQDKSKPNIKFRLLEDLKNHKKPDVLMIKKKLVSLLTTASNSGGYEQSYGAILKLHVINEFEKACSMMLEDLTNLPNIFEQWQHRDNLINTSRGAEFVLGMRRSILDLAVQLQPEKSAENSLLQEEIGKIWLKSSKIARKAGFYQQAYLYTLSASDSCPPQDLSIEQAQLYWQKGAHEDALTTLERCISNYFSSTNEYKQLPPTTVTKGRKLCAKAKLLWAKYNDETLNVDTSANLANYKEANDISKLWGKSCLAIARYYETIVDKMGDEEKDTNGREMQVHIMNYYGKSLNGHCKYVHEAMPRMLTVWLDFSSRTIQRSSESGVQKTLVQMIKIIEAYSARLPSFTWLTAFSQLVSRICHPNKDVQKTLFKIIVKLIKAYPQYCLWMMATVFNSSYTARQKCCKEMLNSEALKSGDIPRLMQSFNKLWERLMDLSNKTIPDGMMETTVSVLCRALPKLLSDPQFGPIMMPISKYLRLHLPHKTADYEHHNPFPLTWVRISGVDEKVAIMPSLQRPRRISLRGCDGKSYLFMCKPKDDLRRDFRLMEFNDVVNKYLQKDPESRRRRLYIRTYSVVPLNEECGLIEWVPNLVGLRPAIYGIYKERKIIPPKDLRSALVSSDSLEKKRQVFVEKMLPRHPAVLGEWFRINFPDPYSWYEARTAYIRTTAVMSMVGYILGLGDRHGENILLDFKNGDAFHVDFNCLFNKGEALEWPERVPFRLTHNMLDAMGPLKYEGPFRESCKCTMKLLREQATILLSILKPFVYDPLVSWSKNQPSDGEKTNEKAVDNIKSIEQRLKGVVRSQGKKLEALTIYLSVSGQVNNLILEAVSIDNLCQMYFGWGPYL